MLKAFTAIPAATRVPADFSMVKPSSADCNALKPINDSLPNIASNVVSP